MPADQRRDRVARQTKQRRLAHPPGHQRFAGPHRDLVERAVHPFGADLRHEVMIAHRRAADGHDQVGPGGQPSTCASASACRARWADPRAPALGLDQRLQPVGVRGHDLIGARVSRRATSSSPVAISATSGRRVTVRRARSSRPQARYRRGSAGAARRSGARGNPPPPAGHRAPGRDRCQRDLPAVRVTSSWITTRSVPAGIGAPVKMRSASPGSDPTRPRRVLRGPRRHVEDRPRCASVAQRA
jgi:hypothetical protein